MPASKLLTISLSLWIGIRGEPMYKKSRLSIPIVKNQCLPTIGRLIGKKRWLLISTKAVVAA